MPSTEVHPTVRDALALREYARRSGDINLERACNADLARYGHQDAPETTQAVIVGQEQAVPPAPRRGRRPLPRCEHGQIADRCIECQED